MHIEAGNTERFARNFKDSRELYIPKVYWDYISKSILVMELIEGIRMDRIDEIRAWDIDPKEIALLGLLGYSFATVLGFWLILSIFRSGKM